MAVYVLEHMDQILYFSVTDLADAAEVGDTTVLRFCRKIGTKGYQEFKLAIAKDLSQQEQEEDSGEQPNGLITSIAAHTKQVIDETVQLLDEKSWRKHSFFCLKQNRFIFSESALQGLPLRMLKTVF